MSAGDDLRLGRRVAGATARTLLHLGRLEAEMRLAPGPQRESVRHRRVVVWARRLCSLFGIELRAAGPYVEQGESYPGRDERGRGRVFILNHRSGLDILVTLACFEAFLVSRADLASWPLIGFGARRIGTLFVDRGDARSGAHVLAQMERALEQGSGISIYPEGTAYAGDEVRPLHRGAFRAAQRAGSEIVPVGLAYADPRTAYGDESFVEHMKRVAALERVVVSVEVGEPFRTDGRSLDELRTHGRQELQRLVDRARARC